MEKRPVFFQHSVIFIQKKAADSYVYAGTVVEEGELLCALPARLKTDATGLANALRYLSERGYVDVKYSDKGTYCICSLPKGRSYEESAGAERRGDKKRSKSRFLLFFFGAMAGAFAGSLLAGVLMYFLFL